MNPLKEFLVENNKTMQLISTLNQIKQKLQPPEQLIIDLDLAYLRTPKNSNSDLLLSKSVLRETKNSLKKPFDNIHHIMYIIQKILKQPSLQTIDILNPILLDMDNFSNVLYKLSYIIKKIVESKNYYQLKSFISSLQNLYAQTLSWYENNMTNILSMVHPTIINEFTEIELEWVRSEIYQSYNIHFGAIKEEIEILITQDAKLQPYMENILKLCNNYSLIPYLAISSKKNQSIELKSNNSTTYQKISDNLLMLIGSIPPLSVKVSFNQRPKMISISSTIFIKNFNEIPNNDITIIPKSQINLNPIIQQLGYY